MALLTLIDVAIKLGVGVELVEYCCKKPIKPGSQRLLATHDTPPLGLVVDEDEVRDFEKFLSEPWPIPSGGGRPHLPEIIKNDIKNESHHMCAICGDMNNGEVAHIEPLKSTLNNSPSNLVFLCPNHHTQYDYGYMPSSNVTKEDVQAAKKLKRSSRRRMLKLEGNYTKLLTSTMLRIQQLLKDIEKQEVDSNRISIIDTEIKALMMEFPGLSQKVQEDARNDQSIEPCEEVVRRIAPNISKQTLGITVHSTKRDVRATAKIIASISDDILIELDEVECPHCEGRGAYGHRGKFCAYCHGDCVVTQEKSEEYNSDDIDEVECPHCHGKGSYGFHQNLCAFCNGDCVVTQEESEDYNPGDIDEVECPHCHGKGDYGFHQNLCAFCNGDCVVTQEKSEEYNSDDIDEVECPHCHGKGDYGFHQNLCAFCNGDCVVTQEKSEEYNPDDIDEVECPHCHGKGSYGYNQNLCAYCHGDCVVTQEKCDEYNPDDIDEVECPHCQGSGTTGLSQQNCKLCNGDTVVNEAKRDAYFRKFPDRR